jgi:hypothetical protein
MGNGEESDRTVFHADFTGVPNLRQLTTFSSF